MLKFLSRKNQRRHSDEKKVDFANFPPQQKIACPNLRLLSMHIPKTAGTSFYQILQQAYGRNGVMRLDYRPALGQFIVKGKSYNSKNLPARVCALHGHLNYKVISAYLELNEEIKIITWLRNPIERVISNYYYLLERLDDRFKVDPLHPYTLDRMTKSLLEFAKSNQEKNRLFKYFRGTDLGSFYFVGIIENFDEDIMELGKRLDWKTVKPVKQNVTLKKPSAVSAEVYEAIKSMNHKDWNIYQQALAMRKARKKNHD